MYVLLIHRRIENSLPNLNINKHKWFKNTINGSLTLQLSLRVSPGDKQQYKVVVMVRNFEENKTNHE